MLLKPKGSGRLGYLDWMRGLAVLLMIQGHAFESWTALPFRSTEAYRLTQFFGGWPAPIFLFLVGASLAVMLSRMAEKGVSVRDRLRRVAVRALGLLALAYAFRLEQFLVWYPASNAGDILRVDTLNCIAICILLAGLVGVTTAGGARAAGVAAALALACSLATPLVFEIQTGAPDHVLSYVNGAGRHFQFSVFPWVGFVFAGMAAGYVLWRARRSGIETQRMNSLAVAGLICWTMGFALDILPGFRYGYFDYSVTSPQYFLTRMGWLLLILWASFQWSQRPTAWRWSPVVVLGQASLLVYWLHIEIVYGRLMHGFHQQVTMPGIATHLVWVIALMLGAAWLRVNGVSRLRWVAASRTRKLAA